jgi:hypothetical protein
MQMGPVEPMSGAGGKAASGKPTPARDAAMSGAGGDDELDAGEGPTPTTMPPDAGDCALSSQKEICNTLDDDCDGKVDENCECPSRDEVACYDGPAGTLNVGACRAGTRSCESGALSPCEGAVLPTEETCNERDDDCNGRVDDLPSLAEDVMNCGRCGNVCAYGENCCDGRCVNPFGEDRDHCGGCGMACSEGRVPGCCGGRCVDLSNDATCGTCNNACGLLRLGGGFVCSCMLTLEAGPQCMAQADGDAWLCE